MDADLYEVRHIAGTRFPVAPWSESRVNGLYEKNERMVFNFRVGSGFLSLVMVAAFGVGNITTPYGPGDGNHISSVRLFEKNIKCRKGDELGAFRLGSTVVMIWSDGLVDNLISEPRKLVLGQKIAIVSLVD
jgi:phosphatidylserine decarboxylase